MTDFAIEEPQERPTSLKVASILSWIAGGAIFFGYGILILMRGFIETHKDEILEQNSSEEIELGLDMLLQNFSMMITYPFLLNILSVIGVILMFKMNKIGFHIYTIAHLILIVLAYMSSGEIGWQGLIISLSFIGIYASNLKFMK